MFEGRHFQNAYVTRDIAKAVGMFRARGQIDRVIEFDGVAPVLTPDGPRILHNKLAFLWVGGLQYELIEPAGDKMPLYCDALPENDSLAFHHACMRVADWAAFRARVEQQEHKVVLEGGGDALKFLYLDTRVLLGHYLEYTWMTEERWGQIGGR